MENLNKYLSSDFIQFSLWFKEGLSFYKWKLDEWDKRSKNSSKNPQHSFQQVLQEAGRDFYDFLTDSVKVLTQIAKDFDSLLDTSSRYFFRKSLFPYISESEFLKRTNLRPRGYPGDFIMMEMIYKNEYLGASSFGKIFHKHPIETKAAEAVRNRRVYLQKLINRELEISKTLDFKILSIACGSTVEVYDFFLSSPHKARVKFYLLDQDALALEESKKKITSIENGAYLNQCRFINESVTTLMRNKNMVLENEKFDLIYSMGLYDYLSFPLAEKLTQKLYSMLKENGKLVIGNYHKKNETKEYMEYIMDWKLCYRSEADMLKLTQGLDFPQAVSIEFEDSKTQMFLEVVR